MRLTLRTMLAYVDEVLEAADAREMEKRISESEFATNLMHRIRGATRSLRLSAPKLHGRGMGRDANTVAEYLDYTLLSERVADFEKVCLESDVHLAEVASCHQIRALVLREPAEIETSSRQRMYALPQAAETTAHPPAPSQEGKKSPAGPDRGAKRKKKRRRVNVPDYLREPETPQTKSRRWAPALAAILLLLAAGGGLAYFWPELAKTWQVAQNQPGPDDPSVNDSAQDTEPAPANQNGSPPAIAAEQPNGANAARAVGETSVTQQPSISKKPTLESSTVRPPEKEEETSSAQDETLPKRAATRAAPALADTAPDESRPADSAANRKNAPRATPNMQNEARNLEPDEADSEAKPGTLASEQRSATRASKTRGKANQEEPAEEAAEAEGIGRLIAERDVLLRKVDDHWQRVPGRGTVRAGERLIALPTYRPSVAMSNGVTLQLIGGAILALGNTDADGAPQLTIAAGRILLLTVAKPDNRVHIQAGDFRGTIEFGSSEAALAIEVRHLLPEGADPEAEPAPTAVDLYLTSGEASWVDQRGRGDKLSGRAHRSLGNSKGASEAGEELPAWIEGGQLNPTERRAAADVESFLRPGKPVAPTLAELASHRRIENTLLAAQSLAMIDEFEPIVPLLNDSRYHGVWTSQIEGLRAAIARTPQTAALVREAFESVRGKEMGDHLYRMLWGYNAQQLEGGAAEQLVEWLGAPDDQLDFRVLSFWNLHHFTGLRLYYEPADPEKQRRTSIQRWKQKLESGLLVPKAT